MKNVYSLQHLRNSAVYDSKEIALMHISSVTSSDGSIALARYKDGNGVKTLIAVNYNENGVDDPTNLSASYTIFSNDDEAIKAINDKLNALPNEFKTINGETIVGSGDISIDSGVGMVDETSASGTGEIFNSYSGSSKNVASGEYSHAEGYGTTAGKDSSHAEGSGTAASGYYSHAEGYRSTANGSSSHAEGNQTTASGSSSHAEGYGTTASGFCSHAEGSGTTASGYYSHAEGIRTKARGDSSHAEGYMTTASGGYGSHAEGYQTTASGAYSHSEGWKSTASGGQSHAEGGSTTASGSYSHAEGYRTRASGRYGSHAEGSGTTASGDYSHAEGGSTFASGSSSHAEGYRTTASGDYSHAEGIRTTARGDSSHAEGSGTTAIGNSSHAEGSGTTAIGNSSHAEGWNTITNNDYEHAQGKYNKSNSGSTDASKTIHSIGIGRSELNRENAVEVMSNGDVYINGIGGYNGTNYSSAKTLQKSIPEQYTLPTASSDTLGGIKIGDGLSIDGDGVVTVGASGVGKVDPNSNGTGEIFNDYTNNKATGAYSHAEGSGTTASGECSHAEGTNTTASGRYSHAEGVSTNASKEGSHAEGFNSTASGYYSHAEGCNSTASGVYGSHAEGYYTIASGGYGSHAEGYYTIASGGYGSHAEGRSSRASGESSHAEGQYTIASGYCSHAEGYITTASGECSHAEGQYTIANAFAQHVMGCYNTSASSESSSSYIATNRAFIIGNGNINSSRGDAFYVLFNGETHADGAYSNDGADYAEMFEWEDGNVSKEDRVGYFVTLQNDKIKVADLRSGYILGIVSSTPMVIGDNPLRWYGKYLNDEWGRPIYETIEYEEEVPLEPMDDGYDASAEEPQTKKVKRSAYVRKINPDWKNEDEYILRTKRDEWACIGLLGKLLVRQDGTLVQGGFCKVGDGGIATMSDNGYYVMKVNSDTQALILFR